MNIRTRCRTIEQLICVFKHYVDGTTLFVWMTDARPVGTEAPFVIALADGTIALRGLGVVHEIFTDASNPYRRPGVVLTVRALTRTSKAIFDQMRALTTVPGVTPESESARHSDASDVDSPAEDTGWGADTILGANPSPIRPPAEPVRMPAPPRAAGRRPDAVPRRITIPPPRLIGDAGRPIIETAPMFSSSSAVTSRPPVKVPSVVSTMPIPTQLIPPRVDTPARPATPTIPPPLRTTMQGTAAVVPALTRLPAGTQMPPVREPPPTNESRVPDAIPNELPTAPTDSVPVAQSSQRPRPSVQAAVTSGPARATTPPPTPPRVQPPSVRPPTLPPPLPAIARKTRDITRPAAADVGSKRDTSGTVVAEAGESFSQPTVELPRPAAAAVVAKTPVTEGTVVAEAGESFSQPTRELPRPAVSSSGAVVAEAGESFSAPTREARRETARAAGAMLAKPLNDLSEDALAGYVDCTIFENEADTLLDVHAAARALAAVRVDERETVSPMDLDRVPRARTSSGTIGSSIAVDLPAVAAARPSAPSIVLDSEFAAGPTTKTSQTPAFALGNHAALRERRTVIVCAVAVVVACGAALGSYRAYAARAAARASAAARSSTTSMDAVPAGSTKPSAATSSSASNNVSAEISTSASNNVSGENPAANAATSKSNPAIRASASTSTFDVIVEGHDASATPSNRDRGARRGPGRTPESGAVRIDVLVRPRPTK